MGDDTIIQQNVDFEPKQQTAKQVKPKILHSRDNLARAVLTEKDAIAIFRQRDKQPHGKDRANLLASQFGVSIKTIRDIWVGRTWYRSTCLLDPSKPIDLQRLQRKVGRPLGAKDSKPRLVQQQVRKQQMHQSRNQLPAASAEEAQWLRSLVNENVGGLHFNACRPPTYSPTILLPVPSFDCSATLLNRGHGDPTLRAISARADRSDSKSAACDDPFHDDWPFWTTSSDAPDASTTVAGRQH